MQARHRLSALASVVAALACSQGHAQTAALVPSAPTPDTTFDLYRGTTIARRDLASLPACWEAARADILARQAGANYSCRTSAPITGTFTPPPAPQPAPPPAPAPAPGTTWAPLANEYGSFTLATASTVRYGIAGSWSAPRVLAAGAWNCGNALFGDPVPGRGKVCEVLTGAAAPSPAPPTPAPAPTPNPAPAPAPSGTLKVMPLGDSITEGCCYRDILYAALRSAGFSVDFVGSRKYTTAPAGQDWDHEAHGGYVTSDVLKPAGTGTSTRTDYLGDQRDLATWFGPQADRPDIVLMHFGTNDLWTGRTLAQAIAGFNAVLAAARARNPNVTFFVAQIIPMTGVGVDVGPLNSLIPAWAQANTTSASRIVVVDQYTGFSGSWTTDGVHPNFTTGSQWLADRWLAAMRSYLGSAPTPSPAPVPAPAPAPTPAPAPAAGLPYVNQALIPPPASGSPTRDIRTTGDMPYRDPDGMGAFRTVCKPSHYNFDDPLIYPGQRGASHLHVWFGNTLGDYASTSVSLLTTGNGTCRGGTVARVAAWVPALITPEGRPLVPDRMDYYQKTGYALFGQNAAVRPIPVGLRMIAGDSKSRVAQQNAYFECNGSRMAALGACAGELTQVVVFPQCHDGQSLASPDHKSHVVYAANSACPASHPVHFPEVSYHIRYYNVPAGVRLSSDVNGAPAGSSAHGDWWNAWDPEVNAVWVREIINKGLSGGSHMVGDGRALFADF